MYCASCRHDVSIARTDAVPEDAQANVPEPDLVCLEIGEWCTGERCPLGAAEPNAMVSRIIRNGLPLDHLTIVRGSCEACGMENEMARYGRNMAACLVCGTSRVLEV
jgi:hypothetical protein